MLAGDEGVDHLWTVGVDVKERTLLVRVVQSVVLWSHSPEGEEFESR